MPLLVGVVALSIGVSFITRINVVAPETRFSFYVVAGLTSGMWLLARRTVSSAALRLAIATIAVLAALEIAERSTESPPGHFVPVAATTLVLGIFGWFSFLRHLEDEARRVGGWRLLAQSSRSRARG